MRSPVTNPFTPGSDRVPEVWAGRIEELVDWRERIMPRRLAGRPETGRVFLGEPGIGKSALAGKIARQARGEGHLTTGQIRIPRGVDPLQLLAESLLDLADEAGLPARREARLSELLTRVEEIGAGGASVRLRAGAPAPAHRALTRLLEELAEDGMNDGRLVVVQLDEVQNVVDTDLLSQLLVVLGDVLAAERVRRDGAGIEHAVALPVAVYLTGLPEFAEVASTSAGATFTRRFAQTLLAPIADSDVKAALTPFVTDGWPTLGDGTVERVWMTDSAVERLVALVMGDPYLFQLAGSRAWDQSSAPRISVEEVETGWGRARTEVRRHVAKQLERLPELELSVLQAMASLDPAERTATAIARAAGYPSAARIGPTTQRLDTIRGLIDRGKPYRFRVRTVEAYLTNAWP